VAYAFLESTTGEKDFLTQLYSRASYEEYVKLLIEEKRPFMLMLIDLDGFKRINDTYGHFVGDQMLIEFSRILMHQFSSEKMISRLAGDEFVIVLEKHRYVDEDAFIQEMVKQCRESTVPHVPQLKFSYGIQEYKQEMTFDELYIQVDHKMYMNKNY
ncbi:MAG: GGDEF domain-containing protein, partial [Spirochaetia bacterium]|nr:GGDEF domain-containing protein [Spirochaetia bacterium]